MQDDTTIGQRLRARREALGLTQRELAERAGTTGTTINRYELGQRHIRWEVWEQLAPALGLHVELVISDQPPADLTDAQREALAAAWEVIPRLGPAQARFLRDVIRGLAVAQDDEGPQHER